MIDLLFVPSAILYFLIIGLLFVYGVNFFYLAYLTWRKRHQRLITPRMEHWPQVTVQLPIYNELYVAERLIKAAAQMDYPPELLEIQVLDDSTDETRQIVGKLVKQLRRQGVDIQHIQRTMRTDYKAGALREGLENAKGDFLAVFDADFLPTSDFLKHTLPYFQDERVGFVQTRWGHVNSDYSLLTRLQSLSIDAHFMVEQFARSRGGYPFNFNGTAGVWRKTAIINAGGWTADTLTEDLDLSYRAYLLGWQGRYLRDVEVPAELPVSFNAYRRQQHRWAHGSLECAHKFMPIIWNSSLPLAQKLEASLHLTGYFVHLLLFTLVLMYPLVILISNQYPKLISLFEIGFLFNATAFAPTTYFLVAQQHLGNRWWRKLPAVFFISAFGAGMMMNTMRAAWHLLRGKSRTFERTPKFGIIQRGDKWIQRRYQLALDPIVFAELGMALFNLMTVVLAAHFDNWVIASYASIFCIGLLFTSGTTLLQSLAVSQNR